MICCVEKFPELRYISSNLIITREYEKKKTNAIVIRICNPQKNGGRIKRRFHITFASRPKVCPFSSFISFFFFGDAKLSTLK